MGLENESRSTFGWVENESRHICITVNASDCCAMTAVTDVWNCNRKTVWVTSRMWNCQRTQSADVWNCNRKTVWVTSLVTYVKLSNSFKLSKDSEIAVLWLQPLLICAGSCPWCGSVTSRIWMSQEWVTSHICMGAVALTRYHYQSQLWIVTLRIWMSQERVTSHICMSDVAVTYLNEGCCYHSLPTHYSTLQHTATHCNTLQHTYFNERCCYHSLPLWIAIMNSHVAHMDESRASHVTHLREWCCYLALPLWGGHD